MSNGSTSSRGARPPAFRALFGTVLSVAVAAAACSPPRDAAGLAGTYAASQTKWGATDTLWLRANGSYRRTFKADDGEPVSDSGSWFISRDKRTVALKGYPPRWRFVHDLMGDTTNGRVLEEPRTISLTIRRSWRGTVRLGWRPEFNWWYVRTDP